MGFYLYQGYKEYGKDMSENEMKKNARNKRTKSKRYQRNTSDLSHRGAYQKTKEQQKVNHIT